MKWSVVEQWKMRLDGEERQMRNAEPDDVDEKSASGGETNDGTARDVSV